jgi:hypothetical protein
MEKEAVVGLDFYEQNDKKHKPAPVTPTPPAPADWANNVLASDYGVHRNPYTDTDTRLQVLEGTRNRARANEAYREAISTPNPFLENWRRGADTIGQSTKDIGQSAKDTGKKAITPVVRHFQKRKFDKGWEDIDSQLSSINKGIEQLSQLGTPEATAYANTLQQRREGLLADRAKLLQWYAGASEEWAPPRGEQKAPQQSVPSVDTVSDEGTWIDKLKERASGYYDTASGAVKDWWQDEDTPAWQRGTAVGVPAAVGGGMLVNSLIQRARRKKREEEEEELRRRRG